MRTDEQAIRDLIANWARASAVGDLPQILSAMSEDAVFLTPGNPPMRGRDSFAAAFQQLAGIHLEASSQIEEIRVSGDMAYAWTSLTVTATPKNGGTPVRRSGHTLTVFRKQPDGSWVLTRDANLLGPAETVQS
jgi:uncharacterized protein (TIGR02246 family)